MILSLQNTAAQALGHLVLHDCLLQCLAEIVTLALGVQRLKVSDGSAANSVSSALLSTEIPRCGSVVLSLS